uniref:RBR-type E3 ubiquitin transferase n=1 Tax=Sinocyclocheilus grahami TaxID=75366 RepID=A0A672KGC4_SINGR
MGNTATKFRKALISGDEVLAYQLYEGNPQFKESLDPNTSYGEPYQHNTPLHYAARHAMTRILRSFLFSKDGNPNKRNMHNETTLHVLCMGPNILLSEGALQPRLARPYEDECRRAECLQMILKWTGAKLDRGEYESADVSATDNQKNTPLHYASASGMKTCVEFLLKRGADLFAENEIKETPCDCAERQHHKELALSLESQMVFSTDPHAEDIEAEYAALDRREFYEGLRVQDLRRLKDMLIVETADMLQAPLFTAEALLRAHDWDREKLLEAWMSNAENCCQRSGVQMPTPPPRGYNTWDTLPSPRTPRTTRSSITSPDEISLTPADDDHSLVRDQICSSISVRFNNTKHECFCSKSCYTAFVENNPAIRWCPRAGCDRAVRLAGQGQGASTSDPLSFPRLQAPAVDCGKGHLFCWECQGEAHEPCDCQTWKMWLQKVNDMKPEELAGVSDAYEDAANCLWLLTNSKPCANCKSPIQKNEGCNHMQCAKCKYDFCWICMEEWKKHSSSTGGYYRCTRYEAIQQVEEQSKEMTVEAEKKHKNFQQLDRFMHYYTRFKNHEHSYQLEERLLKTAKDKMEQLSKVLSGREGGPPDTTFIEDAVHELLKTRRILKCSYPYGFFLEPRSTKKEIFELMQTDLEMVTEDLAQKVNRPYLRTPRHKIIRAACLVQQKRQEFLASVARGVAPNDSPEAYAEFQYRRRHRQRRRGDMASLRSNTPEPDDPAHSTLGMFFVNVFSVWCLYLLPHVSILLLRRLSSCNSLDEDDPNILLAIQLSLQESALTAGSAGVDAQEILANEASLGAIGTSLPTRLDPVLCGIDVPRAALSSSELLEVGDSLKKLGNISGQNVPLRFDNLNHPSCESADGPFQAPSGLMETSDFNSDNANLLGNIMAWFHDMNPQNINLVPSAGEFGAQSARMTSEPTECAVPQWTAGGDREAEHEFDSGIVTGEREPIRPTQLDLVGLDMCAVPSATSIELGETPSGLNPCPSDTPKCDSDPDQPSSNSSEWEGQVHLV